MVQILIDVIHSHYLKTNINHYSSWKTLQTNNMLIYRSCKGSITKKKVILLRKHIFNGNVIPCIKILNKLEEHLVAPQMA